MEEVERPEYLPQHGGGVAVREARRARPLLLPQALALLDPVLYPVGQLAPPAKLGDDVHVRRGLVQVDQLDYPVPLPALLPGLVAEVAQQRHLPVQVLLLPATRVVLPLGDRLDRVQLARLEVRAHAHREAAVGARVEDAGVVDRVPEADVAEVAGDAVRDEGAGVAGRATLLPAAGACRRAVRLGVVVVSVDRRGRRGETVDGRRSEPLVRVARRVEQVAGRVAVEGGEEGRRLGGAGGGGGRVLHWSLDLDSVAEDPPLLRALAAVAPARRLYFCWNRQGCGGILEPFLHCGAVAHNR